MAIGDTLASWGISVTDLSTIGVLFVIIIVIVWYLKHRKDKGISGSDTYYKKDYRSEKRGSRFLKWAWKKFLSGVITYKRIKKIRKSLEKTEEEFKLQEEEEKDQVKALIQLIDRYQSNQDVKLLPEIKARAKRMLADFDSSLDTAEIWGGKVYHLPEEANNLGKLMVKERRKFRKDLRILRNQLIGVNNRSSLYKSEKIKNIKLRYSYVRWLSRSSSAVLEEIRKANELYRQAAQGMSKFQQEGTKLKEKITHNRDIFKLKELAEEVLKQFRVLDELFKTHDSVRKQKIEECDSRISDIQNKRREIFASLKAESQNYEGIIEDEKLAEMERKKKEQAAAEVNLS